MPKENIEKIINIYTDGGCSGNPGPGGFGVAAFQNDKLIYEYNKMCSNTTNNREELKAILHAFELSQTIYKNNICYINSDSAYCVNICNNWIFNWYNNNWKRSKGKDIENLDLIKSLYKYITLDFFNCQVIKTKGHANILGNELADALATNNIRKINEIKNQLC